MTSYNGAKGDTVDQPMAFADVLEAAENLDPDAQAELAAVLNRRLAERGRQRIADSIKQARHEYATGQCKPMTAADIMKEALL
jgi:16S rRNA C1402 N4-methylase RsmH